MTPRTRILTRRDVAALISLEECMNAVEAAFRFHGEGRAQPPQVLGVHSGKGGFHIKAGTLALEKNYFAAKINANFPDNARRFGLPMIQGVLVLMDAESGFPLAVTDSIEITTWRTAATTAVAAKHLARPDSRTVTICGCGNQGRAHLRALAKQYELSYAYAWDADEQRTSRFAAELTTELGVQVKPATDLSPACRDSDICVTCTPSESYFLQRDYVVPGTFVAGVGADNEKKQELDPELLRSAKVVTDVLAQCAVMGDLHHALDLGVMGKADVYAELGEIVAGRKLGRESRDEIIVFDSTGMALQDVAVAAAIYEKAVYLGRGMELEFGTL